MSTVVTLELRGAVVALRLQGSVAVVIVPDETAPPDPEDE